MNDLFYFIPILLLLVMVIFYFVKANDHPAGQAVFVTGLQDLILVFIVTLLIYIISFFV